MLRLLNLYIPWRSRRSIFSKIFKLSNELNSLEKVKNEDSWEHLCLIGISYAALQNHVYRQVLFKLELVDLEMDNLISLIKQMLQGKYSKTLCPVPLNDRDPLDFRRGLDKGFYGTRILILINHSNLLILTWFPKTKHQSSIFCM